MQFFTSKCAYTLLILIALLVLITFVESRKRPTGKKHEHNKKQNDKDDEEEDEDKKITCYQCRYTDVANCTVSEKECKYCFTFNATVYFEKGCLTKEQSEDVDDTQECKTKQMNNFNGTICYCDDDECNVEMINSSNYFVLNILNLLMSFIFLLIFI